MYDGRFLNDRVKIYLRICVNNKRIAWSKNRSAFLDFKKLVELPLSSPCRVVFATLASLSLWRRHSKGLGNYFHEGKSRSIPNTNGVRTKSFTDPALSARPVQGISSGESNPRLQGLRQLREEAEFVLVFIKSTWLEKRCSWSKVLKISKILKLELWTLTKDFAICGQ